MKINYKKLSIFILVPIILGTIVGLLTTINSNIDSIISNPEICAYLHNKYNIPFVLWSKGFYMY